MPSLMASFAPNCNTYTYQGTQFSTNLECSNVTGAVFTVYGTDPTVPYDGCSGEPSEERTMIADQCTSFAGMEPLNLPVLQDALNGNLKEAFETLDITAEDMFYYADCGGGEHIPGINTNIDSLVDDDSNSAVG